MDTFACILNILDEHERNVAENQKKEKQPRQTFAEILDAKKKRITGRTDDGPQKQSGAAKEQDPPDFSMYKLYLSMLLKTGGAAPHISPNDSDSSAVMHESLKVWQSGNRRPFSKDSDLFSTPRFPIVRFMKI